MNTVKTQEELLELFRKQLLASNIVKERIIRELIIIIKQYTDRSDLLSILASYQDTMTPEQTLADLKHYNKAE